jgi:hypothetical protein
MFGKKASEETRRKQSVSHSGEKHRHYGKFGKDNPASKKVNQYSKDGQLVRSWDSIADICRELNMLKSNISRCCRGGRPTAGGFIWRFNNNLLN